MKAVILAAGKGSRLKDIALDIPKPMILFNGKPILEHNILLCKQYGINEIYINTHHLSEKIVDYFKSGNRFGISIKYSYEEELLGTAGALNNFRKYLTEPFFVIYGDNITNFNLNSLKKKFIEENPIAVIGFHYREDVRHSGVAEFDENDRIVRFIEKPKGNETKSKWVNAGVYYLSPRILSYISEGEVDFAKEIFPRLIKKEVPLFGVRENVDVKVFDTPELYNKTLGDK